MVILEYLKHLEQTKQEELDQLNRKRIGYKRKDEQPSHTKEQSRLR